MAEWSEFKWKWLAKHEPLPAHFTWDQIKKATAERGSASKFLRGIDKPEFQRFAERHMRRIREKRTERFYYLLAASEIGVSHGSGTSIARLRWHSGNDIHAYPITAGELTTELLHFNPDEYDRYLSGV